MHEKKNFKKEIKDWWQDNKRVVKASVVCGFIGIMYGFAKGLSTNEKMWLENGFERAVDDSDLPCDEFGLTEEECDDPEFLEIVKFENENS